MRFWALWERAFDCRFLFKGDLHTNALLSSIPTLLQSGLQSPPQRFVEAAFACALALGRLVGESQEAAGVIDNLALGRSIAALHALLPPLSVQVSCEELASVALSNAFRGGEPAKNSFANAAVMKAICAASGRFSPSILLYLRQLAEAYCSSQMLYYVVRSIKNAVLEYFVCFRNERSPSPVHLSSSPALHPPPHKRLNIETPPPETECVTDSETEARMIISSVAVLLSKAETFAFQRNVNIKKKREKERKKNTHNKITLFNCLILFF